MSQALKLQRQNKTREQDYVISGWGKWHNWTAKMKGGLFLGETIRADGPNMHIFDKHSAPIMSYTSTSGWAEFTSTEELKVHKAINDIYNEAYHAAKDEAAKAQASEWRTRITGSTFDTQA